jgi:hypothetical protein
LTPCPGIFKKIKKFAYQAAINIYFKVMGISKKGTSFWIAYGEINKLRGAKRRSNVCIEGVANPDF